MKVSRKEHGQSQREKVAELYNKTGGNVSEIARQMGLSRSTVQVHIKKIGSLEKPLYAGSATKTQGEKLPNPPTGRTRRYLLTSAQNNTRVHEPMWKSLNTLAEHYDAAIMVGTFTYNQNAYGKLSVKRGTKKEADRELWYDSRLTEHIVDQRVELGDGLVWCGEMNILPTAANPLMGLETYSHRKSAIIPHVKMAMRSIATMHGEGTKLNFTTGTCTEHNYIQKREGLIAEHHHVYGALLVEVNDKGNWWVRQVCCDNKGRMQDLGVTADGAVIQHLDRPVEAITWGDIHATWAEEWVVDCSLDMLDALMPRHQFFHDLLEGASINHHESLSPHRKFHTWLRGLHRLEAELEKTKEVLSRYDRSWCRAIVPDSNHDAAWLYRWLKEYDYRKDPGNAEFFLRMQSFMYQSVRGGMMVRDVNLLDWALSESPGTSPQLQVLLPDESFTICNKKIECGMHGHLGADGARGTPASLNKVGRRANTAHTHSAGIYNGLYVAGTSTKLKWDYNRGPSSWSHSHIITYANGQRAIVTMYDGRWRA